MVWEPAPLKHESLYASATETIAGSPYTGSAVKTVGRRGAVVFLDITANTGAFTLDAKLQGYDPTADAWYDINGAAFAQKSATGHSALEVYPGVKDAANVQVNAVLPEQIRVHVTLGGAGTDVTFSVEADLLT